jgi:hypothetical protein
MWDDTPVGEISIPALQLVIVILLPVAPLLLAVLSVEELLKTLLKVVFC